MSTAQTAAPQANMGTDQSWRGERLYPGRLHPRRYSLTRMRAVLKEAFEQVDNGGVLNVLDFGCGNTPYRPLLDGLRARVVYHGADLPPNSLAEINILPDQTLDVADRQFDLVISTQVLEHVLDPSVYLSECHRVLKPGGHLIVSTHGYWMYHPDPTDYWRWTGDGLRRIIGLAGLQVTATRGVGNLAAASIQLFQDASARYVPPRIRRYYAAGMQCCAALACRLTGGDSTDEAIIFVVTAIRPFSPSV